VVTNVSCESAALSSTLKEAAGFFPKRWFFSTQLYCILPQKTVIQEIYAVVVVLWWERTSNITSQITTRIGVKYSDIATVTVRVHYRDKFFLLLLIRGLILFPGLDRTWLFKGQKTPARRSVFFSSYFLSSRLLSWQRRPRSSSVSTNTEWCVVVDFHLSSCWLIGTTVRWATVQVSDQIVECFSKDVF
jgi:hypothetical protein